jgi:hypothetical protein
MDISTTQTQATYVNRLSSATTESALNAAWLVQYLQCPMVAWLSPHIAFKRLPSPSSLATAGVFISDRHSRLTKGKKLKAAPPLHSKMFPHAPPVP